jgi:hypothetical protein
MRGFGVFLLVIGAICACVVHPYLGIGIAILGGILIIAGGGSQTAEPVFTCPHCGNPVAPTANLCLTCHGAITPSQGPLAPKKEWDGKGYCPKCGRDKGHILHCPYFGKR